MRRLQHSFLIAARPAHPDPDPVSELHIRPSLLQNCLLQWVSAKKKRFFTPKNKKSQKNSPAGEHKGTVLLCSEEFTMIEDECIIVQTRH